MAKVGIEEVSLEQYQNAFRASNLTLVNERKGYIEQNSEIQMKLRYLQINHLVKTHQSMFCQFA
jgi:hypothetical protein